MRATHEETAGRLRWLRRASTGPPPRCNRFAKNPPNRFLTLKSEAVHGNASVRTTAKCSNHVLPDAAVHTQAMFGGCSVKVGFGDDAYSAAFNDDPEARLARG
jgi:hypothetical protein